MRLQPACFVATFAFGPGPRHFASCGFWPGRSENKVCGVSPECDVSCTRHSSIMLGPTNYRAAAKTGVDFTVNPTALCPCHILPTSQNVCFRSPRGLCRIHAAPQAFEARMRQNRCLCPCQPHSQGLPTMCLCGARGWGNWDATPVIAQLDSCFFRRQH